jgi:hypothetical protein
MPLRISLVRVSPRILKENVEFVEVSAEWSLGP